MDELLGIDGAIADNIAADIARYFEKQKTTKKKADTETSKNPQLQPPTDYEIRAKLEKAILNDLLGPAGGEEEELDEDNVSDRYLVGLLAPQQRRINLEQEDELAVAGIGTAEEGSTEVSVPPTETMFPSSFGMSFCVNATAKALQVTAGWGQYERTESQTLTKKDDTPKRVWKRRQIRETSPAIPLVEGEIAKWTVHSEFPQVFIQGRIRKQTNGDWIVSLFLVNGQKEPAKLRDEAWLFQPELSVQSADSQHPDIFLKRHQPRSADKLDSVVYKEEKMMAMLYRYKVEFAVGHGVSVHAQTAPSVTQRAVKLSTSVIPAYEVPKTSPPKVSEIPKLAGLVLDMKELSQTPNADFSPKLNALVIAYASWIEDEEKRISNPNEGLADYQDVAKDAINNCKRALERIQQGLTLLQTDKKAAEAFRFMNQAMYLQRIHSIYSEKVRQSQEADLDKIDNPTWYPFQLAFILLNLPSVTDLHHPDRSHETEAIADLLWFPTGGGKTEAYLDETAVDELSSWEVDGKKVRPKVIASTATIRQAESQVNKLFLRQVQVFPPQGLDVQDNFFSRQREPSQDNPGRCYLGICATGRRLKAALIRVYVAILSASQDLYNDYGIHADPWMTLVGYFNSIRELGGMRRLVEDDIRSRLTKMDRRGLARRLGVNLEELTSRKDSTQIPIVLDRLETTFDPARFAKIKASRKIGKTIDQLEPLDVLLATNMISVGVDVKRLGIMAVAGQPKNTAEYIQATSRVGRTHPGLVITVYNWVRPRDLSHYERFEHYHATFYQHVEALSLTPFAPRAIDRGLAALFVALVRLAGREFNGNNQAGRIERNHPYVQAAINAITKRAGLIGDAQTENLVKQTLEAKLDTWLSKAQNLQGGGILKYDADKRDGVTIELLESAGRGLWQDFTCLNSLRNVEPTVGLILQEQILDEHDRLPQPTLSIQNIKL